MSSTIFAPPFHPCCDKTNRLRPFRRHPPRCSIASAPARTRERKATEWNELDFLTHLIVTLARVVRGNRHRNHVDDDDDDDAPMDAKRDDDDASTRRRVSFASTVVEVRRDGTKRNDDDSVRREKRGIGESL